jgi:DNA-binding HxlR family transcriptional regulator
MTVLRGPLADRDTWSAVGECPIEKTMGLLGTKSAMLIMREAFYGTTRFEDFWRRIGITKEPGQRSRDEYVLTEAGMDFMPVVWAMFEWGRRHLPYNAPLQLAHKGCGAEATVEIRCERGHHVPAGELVVQLAKS